MSTLTIRLPDDTAERLRALTRSRGLARSRGLSVNKLIEELSSQAFAAWDTESHFRASAAMGDPAHALAILDRLDAAEADATRPRD
jgi:predicted transcriptional regulator